MTANKSPWIVVTDFDGTLTKKDVGNELCDVFASEQFRKLQSEYRAGTITLKEYQLMMWTNFPCNEDNFRSEAARLGELRAGVNEFLEKCAAKKIPVYIASCGIRPYIEEVLNSHVSEWARSAIAGIMCNDGEFDTKQMKKILMPDNDPTGKTPLHKGLYAEELSKLHGGAKVLAVGNGSSDKSFVGHVEQIAACDKFIDYCRGKNVECIKFEDFRDLYKKVPPGFW
ncbi:MAG TPA: HAD-IB family phosphatase [Bdellovibrionota bacterium]|jgi:2,3-diketo-5-methylthio-1-phosphopentane phosphatase|nr:HAD-IB family phosphatase [Bdellovibrionota bacterium]